MWYLHLPISPDQWVRPYPLGLCGPKQRMRYCMPFCLTETPYFNVPEYDADCATRGDNGELDYRTDNYILHRSNSSYKWGYYNSDKN